MTQTPQNSFTFPLTENQASKLREILEANPRFAFETRPHTLFFSKAPHLSISVFKKGPKILIQGRNAHDFVTNILEPQVLQQALIGYENIHHPELFEPHFGIDESGKGDFFGPLVIAGVFLDPPTAEKFRQLGVTDSKRINSDQRIRSLAAAIRKTRTPHTLVLIPPPKYNQLIRKIGNLNSLLAWGHARAIENLSALVPSCPRALCDKFAKPHLIQNALMEKGRQLQITQRTKAESDYAVAAASILAREAFIDWLQKNSSQLGITLPRGVSQAVKNSALEILNRFGPETLKNLSKNHFKTFHEILNSQSAPEFPTEHSQKIPSPSSPATECIPESPAPQAKIPGASPHPRSSASSNTASVPRQKKPPAASGQS